MRMNNHGVTLVLAIGNILLSDEGCGVRTLEYLRTHHPNMADVIWLDGGTLSFTLLPSIENASKLIVLDAAQLHAQPGSVQCFVNETMDAFLGQVRRSAHTIGLRDMLDAACLRGKQPSPRALVGIQPARLDWGESLSPAVAAAVPVAAKHVLDIIKEWAVI